MSAHKILLLLSVSSILVACYPDGYSSPKNATRTPQPPAVERTITPNTLSGGVIPYALPTIELEVLPKQPELMSIQFVDNSQNVIFSITANGKVLIEKPDNLDYNAREFFKILEKNWFSYSKNACISKWGLKE